MEVVEPSTSEQGRKDTEENVLFTSQVMSQDEEEDSDTGRLAGNDQ